MAWPAALPSRSRVLLTALPLLALACGDDPTEPVDEPVRSATVAASDSAFVDLAADSAVASRGAGAEGWDVGFWQTAVLLPADALVTCICQNDEANDAEIMAMTPSSELADFDGVTRDRIPASGAAWSASTFDDHAWYRYNLTGTDHQIWPTYDVYLVKRGAEVYKVQLTGYYDAAGEPRHITFRWVRLEG